MTQARAQARPRTGALETIKLRNEFYRDKFRMMATATPLLVFALLVSIALNVMLVNRKPVNHYFTVDLAGRVIPVRALSEPYVTDAMLLNWVTEKVAKAYQMDPQNYRAQVGELEPFFTTEGYQQYIESLKSSGTIDLITKNLLVSSAVPMKTPVVVERNTTAEGVYYWRIQIPMLVDYRSSTKSAQKKRLVEVVVVRRQTLESPQGIGISQFVASDTM